tara:strand:- start:3084 stop:4433 length:1350 start_codon:yes stop_codon:yes gene_type:complete
VATDTWSDNYLSAGSHLYSTYLANAVNGYERLADRITYALGYPIVNLELHGNQIFTNIALSLEMFSKYAGYTEEHLVFDSDKYTRGKGLDIAELLTLTPELTATYESTIEVTTTTSTNVATTTAKNFDANSEGTFISLFEFNVGNTAVDPSEYTFTITLNDSNVQVSKALVVAVSGDTDSESADVSLTQYGDVFTTSTEIFDVSAIPGTTSEQVGGSFTNNVSVGVILGSEMTKAGSVNANRNAVSTDATTTETLTSQRPIIGNFDDLTKQKRKVIDVYSHEEAASSSLNTLFTIEQTLAQQTYFSYAMGNYGFDLISWYVLKQWLETREKMLSTKRYFKFDERTQHLLLLPEPKEKERFYGVVSCYVEKPIRFLIKEPWVYQYALALTKITLGRVRGKFGNAQLFGGTSLDTSILQEGLQEKKELETMLTSGAAPGFGDAAPPMFFVG